MISSPPKGQTKNKLIRQKTQKNKETHKPENKTHAWEDIGWLRQLNLNF